MAMAGQGPADAGGRGAFRPVGDRVNPANDGDLGYLYTIYRFYDAEDRLLFLGLSERVRQRIVDDEIGHPRGLPLGHDDGPKPWWREATRIELEHLPAGTTQAEARVEERRQIETNRPVYNLEFNEGHHDRSRVERAIDIAHFEVDVATAEHERHEGYVRAIDQIAVDSEVAAERLRPAGAARLRYGLRGQPRAEPIAPAAPPDTARSGTAASARRNPPDRSDGPGSVAGLIFVLLILLAIVSFALAVSIRAVF
ncbi:MAG: hypothetical protein ACR2QO_17880 [Acidimicrobiales bacterium]